MSQNFKSFFLSMPRRERENYANACGTSSEYIRVMLIGKRRIPRPNLMRNLADNSNGQLTLDDVTKFFYSDSHASETTAQ